jgi:hypothetical protein
MELGIFAKTFRRPDAQTTLEAIRALGLGCVQFNFECAGLSGMPEKVPSSTLTAIAAASRATGVRLAALSGTFNMAHPEPEVRKGGLLRSSDSSKQRTDEQLSLFRRNRDQRTGKYDRGGRCGGYQPGDRFAMKCPLRSSEGL